MRVDLNNQVALVTGAAKGIGRAIAELLAANGAKVVFTDLEPPTSAAEKFAGCRAMALDVTNEPQIDQVIGQVVSELGRLDILVNNAAVNTLAHRVTLDEFPREEWERIINVNLNGVYLMSRAAARVMLTQASGKIINIASVVGMVPLRLQSPYVAAKAAVINLTRSMAIELGPRGILVNAVAPGSTLTDATRALFYGDDGLFRDAAQRMLDHVPLGRPAQPEEIAHAVLFLAAPESSYINGHTLTVDGGWTAGYTRDF